MRNIELEEKLQAERSERVRQSLKSVVAEIIAEVEIPFIRKWNDDEKIEYNHYQPKKK